MPYVPAGSDPVANGVALQNAIDDVALTHAAGGTITLDPFGLAGHYYRGNFTLPDKGAGINYIFIETTSLAGIPEGVRVKDPRVDPSQAGFFARITNHFSASPPVTLGYPIFLNPGAHHYHLRGLEITTAPDSMLAGHTISQCIQCGDPGPSGTPHHDLIYDRLLVHPYEVGVQEYFRSAGRGIDANGTNVVVKHCAVYGFGNYGSPRISAPYDTWTVSATNATPCVLTLSGSGNTFPDPGAASSHKQPISLRGATGSWTPLNGTFIGTYIDNTHVSLETFDPLTFDRTPLNSAGFGDFSGQTVLRLEHVANDSAGVLAVSGPCPLTIHDNLIEAFVYPLIFGGGGTFIPAQNMTTVESVASIGQLTMAGTVGDLAVNDLIAFKTAQPQAVTAASATNPCVLTVAPHRFPAGQKLQPGFPGLKITGATDEWADLNSPSITTTHAGRVVDATHIEVWDASNTVPMDAEGRGALTGTVTWVPASPADNVFAGMTWQVGKVTAVNAGTRVISFDYAGHPNGVGGNGAGVPIAVGSPVQHNGLDTGPITITRNTISCRREWIWLLRDRGKTGDLTGSIPKGCVEHKLGTDVTYEGNTFQVTGGSLAPMTAHAAFGNNQVNQTGNTPWVNLNGHIVRNNLFLNMTYIKTGHVDEWWTSIHSSGLMIENNLFTYTDSSNDWLTLTMTQNATVQHNTVRNTSTPVTLSGVTAGLMLRDNILCLGTYGYSAFDGGTISAANADNNFIIDNLGFGAGYWNDPTKYANDTLILSDAAMGFEDLAGADAGGDYHGYRLTALSLGHLAATDGKDAGVDFAMLDAALGVTSGGATTGGVVRHRGRGILHKPRIGTAHVNAAHPIADRLRLCYLLNEMGGPVRDLMERGSDGVTLTGENPSWNVTPSGVGHNIALGGGIDLSSKLAPWSLPAPFSAMVWWEWLTGDKGPYSGPIGSTALGQPGFLFVDASDSGAAAYTPQLVVWDGSAETHNLKSVPLSRPYSYQIMWTWDGTTAQCYVHGVAQGPITTGGGGWGSWPPRLAASYGALTVGHLIMAMVWSRVVPQAQALQLATQPYCFLSRPTRRLVRVGAAAAPIELTGTATLALSATANLTAGPPATGKPMIYYARRRTVGVY